VTSTVTQMIAAAPAWLSASALCFIYIGAVAALRPRLPAVNRIRAMTTAAAGLAVTVVATATPLHPVLAAWLLPPALLLAAYWASGLLFVAPMPRVERALLRIDRVLGVSRLASAAPRPLAEFLELAYVAVYPVIPLALVIHLFATDEPDPNRFWSVILITDYICFGMLPWVQTRPPRSLERAPPWHARFRALNLRLLGKASIQVNTFPSGHAAEALAAALLVLDAPLPVVVWMFVTALAISAGAVLGRYHYAADAVAGWAVAAGVWLLLKG
jgi:membrane-associated phospholipid phosphatase